MCWFCVRSKIDVRNRISTIHSTLKHGPGHAELAPKLSFLDTNHGFDDRERREATVEESGMQRGIIVLLQG